MDTVVKNRLRMALTQCALLLGVLLFAPRTWAQSVSVDEVKTAYLFNFAKFVEWPADSLPSAASPLNFCTLGRSIAADGLDAFVRGRSVNGHAIVVRHLHEPEELKDCHILFLSGSAEKQQKKVLQEAKGLPVLLVSDSPGFARSGGAVEFVLESGKLAFEINLGAADAARIKINSKLLALGRGISSREERQGQ